MVYYSADSDKLVSHCVIGSVFSVLDQKEAANGERKSRNGGMGIGLLAS